MRVLPWGRSRPERGRPPYALFAGAVLALAPPLAAQEDPDARERLPLTGVVVDAERGTPLVGAFVAPEGSEHGSITDHEGRFRLPEGVPPVGSRDVVLAVEMLGYGSVRWSGSVMAGAEPVLRLPPKPVLLEGLSVVVDRFERRRRAVAAPYRVLDRDDLATSPFPTALDAVRARGGVIMRWRDGGPFCVSRRGRAVEPVVYIDEMQVPGGAHFLLSYRPHDLYMVEVFGRGAHIRIYTMGFMESAARTRLVPIPVFH